MSPLSRLIPLALPLAPCLPVPVVAAATLRRSGRAASVAAGGALAMALTAAAAGAQPPMPGGVDHHMMDHHMMAPRPTVSVTGEGQAAVAPDLATVAVGVTTQAPTAAQAMSDNAAKQAAVIAAVKAQGIAAEDLQTQGMNLSPLQDYSREGQAPVITGYQAQNIVSARVHDLARLGPLLDALVTAGATDVQGISFSREDDVEARDEARGNAVIDARRRAEVMARAAGMQLGPLLSLSEGINQGGPAPVMMMARESKAGGATPVEAGQMILTTQVNGVWALVPQGGPRDGGDGMPMPHPMPHAIPGAGIMPGGAMPDAAAPAPPAGAAPPSPEPAAPAGGAQGPAQN